MNEFNVYSNLEKKFINLVTDKIKVVSLGIFDTLFACGHSSILSLHLQVAKDYLSLHPDFLFDAYDIANMRHTAEKKAVFNKSKINEPASLDDIYSCINLPEEVLTELKRIEIETIKKNTAHSSLLKSLLKKIQEISSDKNIKLFLISDTYYPDSLIKYLLQKHYPEIIFDNLYLALSCNKTKSSGLLYTKLLEDNYLNPSELLHIGSNQLSDHNVPSSLGINTLLLALGKNEQLILNKEKYFFEGDIDYRINLNRTNAVLSRPLAINEKVPTFYYNMGAFIFGPVLVEFCRWVANKCLMAGITRILCFAREGIIFNKILNVILRSDAKFNSMTSEVLYASRQATTYEAILDGIKDSVEEQIDYSIKNNFTVQETLENLCIFEYNKMQFTDMLLNDFIALNGKHSPNYSALCNLISSALNQRDKLVENKFQLIALYVSQLAKNEKYAYVDLGGGGTISKKLNSITSEKSSASFLLFQTRRALEECDNENMIEILFSSFFPFEKGSPYEICFNEYGYVLESLLMGTIGSTHWYSMNNGQVVPKLAKYFHCTEYRSKVIDYFEQGVFSYYAVSYGTSNNYEYSFNDRKYLATILLRLCLCPAEDEVQIFGSLPFDENYDKYHNNTCFTLCNEQAKECVLAKGIDTYIHSLRSVSCDFISRKDNSVFWPAGTITQIDKDYCNILYSNIDYDEPLRKLVDRLIQNKVISVSIYGAGAFCERLIQYFLVNHISINKIFDKKALLGSYEKFGYTIEPLKKEHIQDGESIVIASLAFIDEIVNTIETSLMGKKFHLFKAI